MNHEIWMREALDLAEKGLGATASNPLVGCVLVRDNYCIGKGFHEVFGGPHAEVNAVRSVPDQSLLEGCTVYVTLEPCAHWGKTPPCADLLIEKKVGRVVLGAFDPFPEVAGKGIARLKAAGIDVVEGVLENECRWMNRRFLSRVEQHRPWIILKWAESANGKLGSGTTARWIISGEVSSRLNQQWRAEEQAILVGSQTAILDQPRLTNRSGNGPQPLRVLADRYLSVSADNPMYQQQSPLLVANTLRSGTEGQVEFLRLEESNFLPALMSTLASRGINSILVEGGATLLHAFIQADLWDEIRQIRSPQGREGGVPAPLIPEKAVHYNQIRLGEDDLRIYLNGERPFTALAPTK